MTELLDTHYKWWIRDLLEVGDPGFGHLLPGRALLASAHIGLMK